MNEINIIHAYYNILGISIITGIFITMIYNAFKGRK